MTLDELQTALREAAEGTCDAYTPNRLGDCDECGAGSTEHLCGLALKALTQQAALLAVADGLADQCVQLETQLALWHKTAHQLEAERDAAEEEVARLRADSAYLDRVLDTMNPHDIPPRGEG